MVKTAFTRVRHSQADADNGSGPGGLVRRKGEVMAVEAARTAAPSDSGPDRAPATTRPALGLGAAVLVIAALSAALWLGVFRLAAAMF
jgi:hypothetical protein